MSESQGKSPAQFRADQPREQEAVRTTIVGGRPPGSGQPLGAIPRGIEVLVRKASVDPEFKQALLADRAEAAGRIDLALDPAEAMMLAAVPDEQLEAIIAQTTVPREHRRAFLGAVAAAMLAAVGLMSTGCPGCPEGPAPTGIAPDDPTLDDQGRPKRDIMRGEGGAAPEEPFEDPPPDVSGGSSAPGTDEPADSPVEAPTISAGIRALPNPPTAGSRPTPPSPGPGAEPPSSDPTDP